MATPGSTGLHVHTLEVEPRRSDFLPDAVPSALSYGRGGGCFVSRARGALLAAAVVVAVVLAAAFGRYVWAPLPVNWLTPGGHDSSGPPTPAPAPADGDEAAAHGAAHRLPTGVVPTRYRLLLWPVLDQAPPGRVNFTFEGRVAITLRVDDPVDRLTLHAATALALQEKDVVLARSTRGADQAAATWESFPGNASGHATATPSTAEADVERIPVVGLHRSPAWELVEVRLGRRLTKGHQYTLFMRFNGTLGDSLTGFYRSSYPDPQTEVKRWVAVTHMQPTHARQVFPCLDEPGLRASFSISLARSVSYTVMSNAPLRNTTDCPGVPGWKWDHFEDSVPMPTYLVAFAVTDFGFITPEEATYRIKRSSDGTTVELTSAAPITSTAATISTEATSSTAATTVLGSSSTKRESVLPPTQYVTSFTTESPQKTGHILIRLWARPAMLDKGLYAVNLVPKLLEYFADYFQVPYPLSKIDLLAIADFPNGAMENWGLIIFRESNLLVDTGGSSRVDVERVAQTVAHELAHQWFGNLVTPLWWDELWLNEGFAEYMQYLAMGHVEPDWSLTDRFQSVALQPALDADSSGSSRAIAGRVHTEHDVQQAFDEITYNKGACLVRMLHHTLGDTIFRRGVSKYLQTWQHNSTTEPRLWEPLTSAVREAMTSSPTSSHPLPLTQPPVSSTSPSHSPSCSRACRTPPDPAHPILPGNATVAMVMANWTRAAGYPVVNVTKDNKTGDVTFVQDRFLDGGWERDPSRPYASEQLWFVPLSYATAEESVADASALDDERPRAWLVNRTLVLKNITHSPADWILVNLHQAGFYRVNYDRPIWRSLGTLLRLTPERLPEASRAQLLGDAFSLAAAGMLDYVTALDLTTYLGDPDVKEHALRPWLAALNGFDKMHAALRGQPDMQLLEKFMQRLLRPMWNKVEPADPGPSTSTTASLRQDDDSSDPHDHNSVLLQALVVSWACQVQMEKCVIWAHRSVHMWRMQQSADAPNSVPPMLRDTAYCAAVRVGAQEVWDFLWDRYLAAKGDPAHQVTILNALACSRDPSRIAVLLERSLADENIRHQDAESVWVTAGLQPVAGLVVFRYLREHWTSIFQRFGEDSVVSPAVVQAAILGLNTRADLVDLEAFRSEHKETLGAMSRALDASIVDLRTVIKWRERYLEEVRVWLKTRLAQHTWT